MKKLILSLTILSLLQINASAQSEAASVKQVVTSATSSNPNVLIVCGKLIDATNSQPVNDAKINFDKVSEGLLSAAVDEHGNYAFAIDKDKISKNTGLLIKIQGYEDYKIKKVLKNNSILQADVRLQPDESKQPTVIKYKLSDDPYGTLVIKF